MSLKHARQHDQDTFDEPAPSDPLLRHSGVQAKAAPRASVPPVSFAEAGLPLISIGSRADVGLLEPTYAYLSAYTFATLPPRVAERLNVAIYELLSNALRYGSSSGEVRFELFRTTHGARMSVTNYAAGPDRERLLAQVERVELDAAAAFSAEMARFEESSQTSPMLGIVRVVHESKLPLELAVQGDLVRLSSHCDG